MKNTDIYELGRVPPQDTEMEEAVIGACLLEADRVETVINIVTPESFYKSEHQAIFNAMASLFNANKPIDMLTVVTELRAKSKLDEVGGPAYITALTGKVSSGSHVDYHARIIQQKYIRRQLIAAGSKIIQQAYDDSVDLQQLIDDSNNSIAHATTSNIKKMGRMLREIGKERINQLEKIYTGEINATGIKCFDKLDRLTSGWQPQNLIIIAARPGMGKTFVALYFARKAAMQLNNDESVVVFSLEMSETELFDRELSQHSGIENKKIRRADFSDQDWFKLENALHIIEGENIIVDDTAAVQITEFKAKARIYVKKYGCKMIIIDYIQLMKSAQHKFNREQEVSFISGQLKATAKELNISIIALSQLNRSLESRADKRPQLSDLRESGAIEQDADIVSFIHRPEYYGIMEDEHGNSYRNVLEIIVAKARAGNTGIAKLYKNTDWTQFYESDPEGFDPSDQTQIF